MTGERTARTPEGAEGAQGGMIGIELVQVDKPEGMNIILGMSHFIRTVEDLHEAMVTSAPDCRFGLAFCEASQERLMRHSGTDEELRALAAANVRAIGAGHVFLVMLAPGKVFPIHVLRAVREVPEVCRIFCATGNPVQVVVARTGQGAGVLGVVDGMSPLGIEGPREERKRKEFLRAIGLKL